jgi:hypothetical protein
MSTRALSHVRLGKVLCPRAARKTQLLQPTGRIRYTVAIMPNQIFDLYSILARNLQSDALSFFLWHKFAFSYCVFGERFQKDWDVFLTLVN